MSAIRGLVYGFPLVVILWAAIGAVCLWVAPEIAKFFEVM